jgi:hypothetical protein
LGGIWNFEFGILNFECGSGVPMYGHPDFVAIPIFVAIPFFGVMPIFVVIPSGAKDLHFFAGFSKVQILRCGQDD